MQEMPLQDEETLLKLSSETCKSLLKAGRSMMHLGLLSLSMGMASQTKELLQYLDNLKDISASIANISSSMLKKIDKPNEKREDSEREREREKGVRISEV